MVGGGYSSFLGFRLSEQELENAPIVGERACVVGQEALIASHSEAFEALNREWRAML